MLNIKYLYLFVSLFFLLNISNVFAFTQFNNNPIFNNSVNYYLIEDYGSYNSICYFLGFIPYGCTNQSLSFNYTVTNTALSTYSSNKLLMYATTSGQYINETLRITPLNNNLFLQTNNYTASSEYQNNYGYLLVSKNQELILDLRYRINGTDNLLPTETKLLVYILSKDSLNYSNWNLYTSYDLNPINYAITSFNTIIPATLDDYYYKFVMQFRWTGMLNTTSVEIDRFDIFTFDITESRLSWSNNATSERERYCGLGSTTPCTTVEANTFRSGLKNGNTGYVIGQNKGYNCIAFKLGNMSVGRRIISIERTQSSCPDDNFCGANVFKLKDMYFFKPMVDNSNNCIPMLNEWLIESYNLYLTTFTVLNSNTSTWSSSDFITDSDNSPSGNTTWRNTTDGILNIYPNALRQTITHSNFDKNLGGSNWRFNIVGQWQTAYFPFFTSSIICESKTICDPAINSQYYQDINCQMQNLQSCNLWGCKQDLSSCNYGIIGTNCLDNFSYKTSYLNGTIVYGTCYPNKCYQLTSNSISCVDISTNLSQTCIDENGNTVACSELSSNILTYTGNSITSLNVWINNSMRTSFGSEIIALLISTVISLGIFIKLPSEQKGVESFAVPFLIFIAIFAAIGFFPLWIFLLMSIMTGVLIFWKAKGG